MQYSRSRVLLESNRPREEGESFVLRFFVPAGNQFVPLSMKCVIEEVHDVDKLRYEAAIWDIDEKALGILMDYVACSASSTLPVLFSVRP